MDATATATTVAPEGDSSQPRDPRWGRGQRWLLGALIVAMLGVLVVGARVVVGPQMQGEELTVPEVVALAESGRVQHVMIYDGRGYMEGEYRRSDGSVAAYHTHVEDDTIEEVLHALLSNNATVTIDVQSRFGQLARWLTAATTAAVLLVLVASIYLLVAWQGKAGPFRRAPPDGGSPLTRAPASGPAAQVGRVEPPAAVMPMMRRDHAPGAIASLTCGAVGFFVPVPLVLPIVAVMLGTKSQQAAALQPNRYTDELGTVGRVLGWIGIGLDTLVLSVLAFLLFVLAVVA